VYQLIYQSVCRTGLTLNVLREIARESSKRNRERGITGIMLVQGRNVVQVLEGEEDVVLALYDSISKDARHGGCEVLLTRHCSERAFEDWHMGLCEVDPDDADLFRLAVSSIKARRRQRDNEIRRSA
jgi:hypothetical protein